MLLQFFFFLAIFGPLKLSGFVHFLAHMVMCLKRVGSVADWLNMFMVRIQYMSLIFIYCWSTDPVFYISFGLTADKDDISSCQTDDILKGHTPEMFLQKILLLSLYIQSWPGLDQHCSSGFGGLGPAGFTTSP